MHRSAGLILANRAYLDHGAPPGDPGGFARASEGGLLAAVRPAIAPWIDGAGTTWIGAGRGAFDHDYTDRMGYEMLPTARGTLRHRRLFFAEETWRGHYAATANAFAWPLLHLVRCPLPELTGYYPRPVTPTRAEWEAFERVNRAFAHAVLDEPSGQSVWIHDYQLALAPRLLREAAPQASVGFFLHTPFPEAAVVAGVVHGAGTEAFGLMLRGMLGADLVGLQSPRDVERLQRAAVALLGATVTERGVAFEGRETCVGAYPVGIDVDELLAVAENAELPPEAAGRPGKGPLVAGLERADFTKGIPERLQAAARTYASGVPFNYIGVAAPTRSGVPGYERLDEAIAAAAHFASEAARAVGGRFQHLTRSMPWPQVVALQREANVVFTSSLADGMNLVPLQAAAAQSLRPERERGAVVAGRDAGVSSAFAGGGEDGITLVDPLDADAMERTMQAAVAGDLPPISDRLIERLRTNDARAWATRFLRDLEEAAC